MRGWYDANTPIPIKVDDSIAPARLEVVGPEAHGAAATRKPLRLGLTYQDAVPAIVDDGDVDEWRSDGKGRAYFLDGGLQEAEAIASAAYTSTQQSSALTNPGARGLLMIVNVTDVPGSAPSLTPKLEFKIPNTSTYVDWCTVTAAIVATGEYVYLVYPGNLTVPGSGTGIVELFELALPMTLQVTVTHGNANTVTYSVQLVYLL